MTYAFSLTCEYTACHAYLELFSAARPALEGMLWLAVFCENQRDLRFHVRQLCAVIVGRSEKPDEAVRPTGEVWSAPLGRANPRY